MVFKNRLISVLLLAFLGLLVFAAADPTGPTTIVIESNNTSSSASSGTLINISGGYIAKVNLTATVQNSKWKAFVGDVTGAFTLDDATGSTIYNWSSGSSSGEVFATRTNGPVLWTNPIACASAGEITSEDTALGLTGSDNITSTFSKTNNNAFTIAGTTLGVGTCRSQNTFVDNSSQDTTFEQIVTYDGTNIVYATFVNSTSGYDGGTYDFQMLVPDNSSSTAPIIPYYLFVELD